MRINQFNISDCAGGSSRAAYRLHRGLLACGEQSRLIVLDKQLPDETVLPLPPPPLGPLGRLVNRTRNSINARRRRHALAGTSSFFTWDNEAPVKADLLLGLPPADITHLHWINRFLRLDTCLPALAARNPVVWTLHDANLAHGGWHYDPFPTEITAAISAEDGKLASDKRRLLNAIPCGRLVLVCPSHWLAGKVRPIPEISRHRIEVIANGIEIDFFRPGDAVAARRALGLPVDRPVVGFVAHALSDERKGLQVLLAACSAMPAARRPLLLCAGSGRIIHPDVIGLGAQQSDVILRLLYQASDLFVCPSLHDNLPNTILEALACGVPVVASNVGGIPEAVGNGIGGLLTPVNDPAALRGSMDRLLLDSSFRRQLADSARARAVTLFDQRKQAEQHIALYQELNARPQSS